MNNHLNPIFKEVLDKHFPSTFCKHWREMEDGGGNLREVCGAAIRSCSCSGVKEQCNYPEKFEPQESER